MTKNDVINSLPRMYEKTKLGIPFNDYEKIAQRVFGQISKAKRLEVVQKFERIYQQDLYFRQYLIKSLEIELPGQQAFEFFTIGDN